MLARKYSLFTVLLLGWVLFIFLGYDLSRDALDFKKGLFLVAVVGMVAAAVSRFTNRIMGRPLDQLQRGVTAVREGRLEYVQVSRTGDEIEYLADSVNAMIEALKSSREELRQHQETLEERIRLRTEALEEATQRALSASQAKSEFLANVSHELRTPMNGVLGMIDILIEDEPRPAQRENLETARSCANTLLALLNDILDLSKIEAGRMLLEQIPFDLREVAADCVKSMAPKARQKGIELRIQLATSLPPKLVGDPLRIRQILMNLLSNAVKFTDKGWVEVRVKPVASSRNDRVDVAIEVADTGTGIPPEKHRSIFEQFTQADGSISRKYGGTGLGLAIVRRLVEMHDGRIELTSAVGVGSEFRATLRLKTPAADRAPANEDAPGRPALAPEQSAEERKGKILVAEDNAVNRKVILKTLERRGFQVHMVGSGQEAIEALGQEAFDLVIMDVQMPGVDGIEAARRIRADQRWRLLPIIAVTAHAMEGDRERCLAAGMNGYLTKPVETEHLLATIRHWLNPRTSQAPDDGLEAEAGSAEPASDPIDHARAAEFTGLTTDQARGMALLFLQLAPEQVQQMQSSAVRRDLPTLRSQAKKLQKSAERIAAAEVAASAAELTEAVGSESDELIQQHLLALERAIRRLERHIGSAERSAGAASKAAADLAPH
jgi:signal transduction histidine kinase/DNA-binding response OmpR family regulator